MERTSVDFWVLQGMRSCHWGSSHLSSPELTLRVSYNIPHLHCTPCILLSTRYTNTPIQKHKYTNTQIQIHQYTNTNTSIHKHKYTNTPIHQYTNTQIHKYTNTTFHTEYIALDFLFPHCITRYCIAIHISAFQ